MKFPWALSASVVLATMSGCQCCPWFNAYANTIDDISDTHVYFDHLYSPKFDLTRMGRPDWYSRFNSWWCPNCARQGQYDRFDDCNLYPPIYPYSYPSNIMPPPTYKTKREPQQIDIDMEPTPGIPGPDAVEPPPVPLPDGPKPAPGQ